MNFFATLKVALTALRVNKLRSMLTMLGIIIGVAAVITMVAVGAGAQARVEDQIKSLGSNLIIILSGNFTVGRRALGSGTQLTISEDDAYALAGEIPSVQAAAPTLRSNGQVVFGNSNWATQIFGITPDIWSAAVGSRRGPAAGPIPGRQRGEGRAARPDRRAGALRRRGPRGRDRARPARSRTR